MRNKAVTMSSRPVASEQLPSLSISFLQMSLAVLLALVGGVARDGLSAGLVALVWSSSALAGKMTLLSRSCSRGGHRQTG